MEAKKITIHETDRLVLKIADREDVTKIYNYFMKNRKFLEKWEPQKIEGFFQVDTQIELINLERKGIDRGKDYKLWFFPKDNPYIAIGSCGLYNIIRGAFNSAKLGYRMDMDYLQQGYATEAIRKIVEIGFEKLRLHRIEANIMPENFASIRVAEKAGLTYEGRSRRYLKINGEWCDHIHMVILEDDIR